MDSHAHTITLTHPNTHAHPHSRTHTHTHTHAPTLTPTHTHAHKHTRTYTPSRRQLWTRLFLKVASHLRACCVLRLFVSKSQVVSTWLSKFCHAFVLPELSCRLKWLIRKTVLHTHTITHTLTRTYPHKRAFTPTHIYTQLTHIHIHSHTFTNPNINTLAHLHHTHTTYTHTLTHTHTHPHIHTHTHTHNTPTKWQNLGSARTRKGHVCLNFTDRFGDQNCSRFLCETSYSSQIPFSFYSNLSQPNNLLQPRSGLILAKIGVHKDPAKNTILSTWYCKNSSSFWSNLSQPNHISPSASHRPQSEKNRIAEGPS